MCVCGALDMVRIRCRATGTIKGVGGSEVVVHGSPTDTFRVTMAYLLSVGGTFKIYGMQLCDSSGSGRDYTGTLTFSKPADNQVRIRGRIDITANYSIGYINLHADVPYGAGVFTVFTLRPPSPIDVKYGYSVDVTVTITFGLSISTSGDLSGGSASETLSTYIADVVGRFRSSNDLTITDIVVSGSARVSGFNFQNTKPSGTEVDVRKTFDITSSGTIDTWSVVLANNARAITISKPVYYTAGQRIVVNFHFYT